MVVDEHHPNASHGIRSLAGRAAPQHGDGPVLRPYADRDWEGVLDLCLQAFAPACASLERWAGAELDWRTPLKRYLRSLTRSAGGERLVVAVLEGSVVGLVHYHVDRETRTGSIGVSAVRPDRQGRGLGSLLYTHALDAMWAEGVRHVTADTGADASHAAARRAYEKIGFVPVPTVHYFLKLRGPSGGGRRRGPGRR